MLENTPWLTLGTLATVILLLAKELVSHRRHSKCDTELAKAISGAVAITRMEGKVCSLGESIGRLEETMKRIDSENRTARHDLANRVNGEILKIGLDVAVLKERVNKHHESTTQ